jgi:hypothetical protein
MNDPVVRVAYSTVGLRTVMMMLSTTVDLEPTTEQKTILA